MGITIQAVDIDPAAIAGRIVDEAARRKAQEILYTLVSDYVPRDTGRLMRDVEITPDGITYRAPYAARVYNGEGLDFSKEKNPLATAQWDKAAMAARKGQLIALMQAYFNN